MQDSIDNPVVAESLQVDMQCLSRSSLSQTPDQQALPMFWVCLAPFQSGVWRVDLRCTGWIAGGGGGGVFQTARPAPRYPLTFQRLMRCSPGDLQWRREKKLVMKEVLYALCSMLWRRRG